MENEAYQSPLAQCDSALIANRTERDWLGLSEVGHPCDRYLWLQHNGYATKAKSPGARVLRIFELGNSTEDIVKEYLTSGGLPIYFAQFEVSTTCNGVKLFGHIDGVILGAYKDKECLWECKSINEKGYKQVVKKGYEAYKPQYKAQVHIYGTLLDLDHAYVTVYNKNTSEIYDELIKVDCVYAQQVIDRVFEIIELDHVPHGKCPNGEYFEAKFCKFCNICFE